MFLTTLKVLKEVLQIKSYKFIKPPLVTNDIGKILGKKGLLFVEPEVRGKLLLPSFSRVHIKGLVLGFWSKGVEMTESSGGGALFPERLWRWWGGGGSGGDGEVVFVGDAGYIRLFRL